MEEQNTPIPDWLKNLQENSWELELLISGGAIFSLFQFSDLWLGWIETFRTTSSIAGTNILLIVGMFGIKVLTVGFILHLSFRAFWLAMVCINFVYPEGINRDKINLKAPFKNNYVHNSDLQEKIMSVDKLCGTVMFMSITYAFALIGLLFSFYIIIILPSLVFGAIYEQFLDYVVWFILMYVFDLMSFGLLRKIPYLSYISFPFFKVFDFLSLRFVYQRPLYLLHTNVNKFKLISSTAIFLVFALCFTYLSVYRIMHWPNVFDGREYRYQMADNESLATGYYRDIPTTKRNRKISIQSKLIKDNYIELFVLYRKDLDYVIKGISKKPDEAFLSDILKLKIDGEVLKNVEWYPTWTENIDQIGVTTMVSIAHLKNKKHTLSFWNPYYEKYDNIVFWKDAEKYE